MPLGPHPRRQDRHDPLGLHLYHLRQLRLALAGRNRRNRPRQNILEPVRRAKHAKFGHRVRPPVQVILTDGFTQGIGIQKRIAQVIGHLKGGTDARAKLVSGLWLMAGGNRAHLGRGNEQRAGFRAVIGLKINLGLAFPALPRANAVRHAAAPVQRQDKVICPRRILRADPRQHLKRHDNKPIAGQHRKRFAKGAMHRRLAAPDVGIVKSGQIIVHEAGAVNKFKRNGGGI